MQENPQKIALITGSSRGIGAAIAKIFAENDYIVIGTATTDTGANKISETLQVHNPKNLGICLNVADLESIKNCQKIIEEHVGAPQILINNAGITKDNLMMRMKQQEWNEVINTNLNSIFNITQTFIKGMLKVRFGRIINISSVVGATGNFGQANYAAAKAGVIGFTKTIARELGSRNITANCIAPGFIITDMTEQLPDNVKETLLNQIPLGRLGEPQEIAKAALFLAQHGDYITGQTIHINGGMFLN
jgi:3-oxoacyl-[acyl-carrier protein] reductase